MDAKIRCVGLGLSPIPIKGFLYFHIRCGAVLESRDKGNDSARLTIFGRVDFCYRGGAILKVRISRYGISVYDFGDVGVKSRF